MSFLNFTLPFPATLALAAVIQMIIGAIWYNPNVFGKAWLATIGKTEEQMKAGANMALTFGLAFVCSFFVAFSLTFIVIHQYGFMSMVRDQPGWADPNSPLNMNINDMLHHYGHAYRTFRHGALHGTITAIFFITPVVGTIALFEQRGFKYVLIHSGFWIVSLATMGAFICHFLPAVYR